MSKIIASAAIRGAHKIVNQAEAKWHEATERWGAGKTVGFPNTAYYLPVIYGITGQKVEKLGYEVIDFRLQNQDNKGYYILKEKKHLSNSDIKGWGTYLINKNSENNIMRRA